MNATEGYYDTFSFFEDCIIEVREKGPDGSRLKNFVPTIGTFHTHLPLRKAFGIYDAKYFVTKRRQVPPSFNEIRHILNIAQVLAINKDLKLISFDGDNTLYKDGGNFADNENLSWSICSLMRKGIYCALITAAGYGYDGKKYAIRLEGLFKKFIAEKLTAEEIARFFVFGGECNYLLRCELSEDGNETILQPIPDDVWQADSIVGPKPSKFPPNQIKQILDTAETSMRHTCEEMHLRAKILRKERAVGMFPGGDEFTAIYPKGHGSKKLKREALDEVVLRVMDELRVANPPITIPFCVFNGGRDAWIDIGNKRVGVECLQSFLGIPPSQCLHVGDQFLTTGNDIAARFVAPCVWIISPNETEKMLEHILTHLDMETPKSRSGSMTTPPISATNSGINLDSLVDEQKEKFNLRKSSNNATFCVYTGNS